MARVLSLLALVTTFLVVAARLAGLPLAVAAATDEPQSVAGSELRPTEPSEDADASAAAPFEEDDDVEIGSAPLMPLSSVALQLPPDGEPSGVVGDSLSHQQALPSHAQSLDRPPRG